MRPEPDEDGLFPETAPLRRLRLLVTTLTIVLIAGVLTVSTLLVIRLGGAGARDEAPVIAALPETIAVPAGFRVIAVGRGRAGEVLLVVEDGEGAVRLRAHDAATGALLSEAAIVTE